METRTRKRRTWEKRKHKFTVRTVGLDQTYRMSSPSDIQETQTLPPRCGFFYKSSPGGPGQVIKARGVTLPNRLRLWRRGLVSPGSKARSAGFDPWKSQHKAARRVEKSGTPESGIVCVVEHIYKIPLVTLYAKAGLYVLQDCLSELPAR